MNLDEVLDRATDGIEPLGLAGVALTHAGERRARRRAVAGAVVGVVAVIAVVGGAQVWGGGGDDRPAEPVAPTATTTTTGAVSDRAGPRWDPLTVPDAPLASSVLPEVLDPPDQPPKITDDPMSAAVVAWPEAGFDLRLLGTDGRWRCVPGTADLANAASYDVSRPALSVDGTRVAIAGNDGVLVVDLTTGEERTVPWPEPLAPPWDGVPGLGWLGDRLVVRTWPRTWLLGLDGSAEPAPYGRRYDGAFAVDPDHGLVVEKRYTQDDLRVWDGDEVVGSAPVPYWGERLATRFGRLAFTGGGYPLPNAGGPLVLDVGTGEVAAYRPIRDPHATYSDNGHLTALGFVDADTVVYLVGPAEHVDRRLVVDAWYLVVWDLDTGEFERLTSGGEAMRWMAVAPDALDLE